MGCVYVKSKRVLCCVCSDTLL